MAQTSPPSPAPGVLPSRRPDSLVRMADFPGVVPSADPHDLPPGAAAFAINAAAYRPGELRARPGWLEVSFDQE